MAESSLNGVFESDPNKNLFNKSKLGFALIGVIGASAIGLTVLALPFVSPGFRKICVPFVPATNVQVQNAMKCLVGVAKKGTVVDLGSGDGRLVIAAAKHGFRAEGVELNFWLVMYSRFLSWKNKTNHLTRFSRTNLWTVNLSCYDNVIIFGTQELMEKLDMKLTEDNFKGLVIVCRFPFVNKTPVVTAGSGIDTVWVYNFSKFH